MIYDAIKKCINFIYQNLAPLEFYQLRLYSFRRTIPSNQKTTNSKYILLLLKEAGMLKE